MTRRLAGTIFLIRVTSAALAYLSQILLARWMGGSDYGVYVYVWTWVLLLGSMMDFGISASAQKIIPEYRTRGEHALLRGFLSGSRWMTFTLSAIGAVLLAGVVHLAAPWIDPNSIVPLYIGCLTLPAFVVANTQDGIARSHDWMRLGLMPQFIVRQTLIIGITAGAFALGFQLGAAVAMLASAAAVWIAMIGQMIVLNRRLGSHLDAGPSITISAAGLRSPFRSCWSKASIFCCPTPTCWCCSNSGRPKRSASILPWSRRSRWCRLSTTPCRRRRRTGSPNIIRSATKPACRPMSRMRSGGRSGPRLPQPLLLLALGKPLLWLFGPQFVVGYDIMFIAAIGLVVRSAIGPVERLLNMLGHQHICALAYALAFAINVALCIAMVPRFGGHGAAAATSIALTFESVLLFWIVRRRLGLHVLAFGNRQHT